MKIGSIINYDKEIKLKVTKKLNNGLYKAKVIKGDEWYPEGKIYETDGVNLFEYIKGI